MKWYHFIPIVIAAIAITVQVIIMVQTGISAQQQIDENNAILGLVN
jgi:uncharacterized protein YoxC